MTATIMTLINEFPLVFVFRVVLSLAILSGLICVAFYLYKRNKFSKTQRNAMCILSLYTVIMFYNTVIGRYSQSYYRYDFNLFASYRLIFETGDKSVLIQTVINLLMFVPIAFLLCIILEYRFKYLWVFDVSVSLIFINEVLQFITRTGTIEIDDILNNLVGVLLGIVMYNVVKLAYRLVKNKKE